MPPQRSRNPKKGKRYHLELSRTSMFFWSLGMFFLLAWIFVLGILVGRGVFPESVETLTELKSQIVKLQNMLSGKEPSALEQLKGPDKEPKFAFYDELEAKGKALPKKDNLRVSISPGPKKPVKGTNNEITASKTAGAYALQLASLESETKATRMIERLTNQGYPAYSYKIHIKGKTYYRVRCGTFKTRQEALYYKNLLAREERINGLVIKVGK